MLFYKLRFKISKLLTPDVFERRNFLERVANTDELTGLPNRRAFELAKPNATSDKQTAFIYFDANNFGLVNKRVGHDEGDRLLEKFGKVFQQVAFRYKCRAFRIGGDEFVILCDKKFAEQIRKAVEGRIWETRYDDFTVSISGAIGATAEAADQLLQARKADRKKWNVPQGATA